MPCVTSPGSSTTPRSHRSPSHDSSARDAASTWRSWTASTSGLPSGTVHPILARLETVGWLTSRWEDIDPRAEGRPARRYYQLTPDGLELARAALALAYSATARPAWLRPLGEEP